jgi:hypothetical protein
MAARLELQLHFCGFPELSCTVAKLARQHIAENAFSMCKQKRHSFGISCLFFLAKVWQYVLSNYSPKSGFVNKGEERKPLPPHSCSVWIQDEVCRVEVRQWRILRGHDVLADDR